MTMYKQEEPFSLIYSLFSLFDKGASDPGVICVRLKSMLTFTTKSASQASMVKDFYTTSRCTLSVPFLPVLGA